MMGKGETQDKDLQLFSLLPLLSSVSSFLVLLEKEWELPNVACTEDIHSDDTIDQRKVPPEQGQRTIIEGFMGERMGNGLSCAPLII